MSNKAPTSKTPSKQNKIDRPGMMGDGTEEQNLNEPGDPSKRIKKGELDATFGKSEPKRK